ncbi:MAG: hypothetical protein ACREU3_05025 [Steroidobacteraceae bacterium]
MARKQVSLANLAVNAPQSKRSEKAEQGDTSKQAHTRTGESVREQDSEDESPVQISFRVNRDAYRDLKRMAIDEDLTIKELVIRAINERRERMGLKKLAL